MHRISSARMASDEPQQTTSLDSRILFTDIVDIVVNNYGVVMNFMQNTSPKAQPVAVARVGMSREHAKSVLQILQVTLAQTEKPVSQVPNKLTAPDNSSPDDRSLN